MRRSPGRLQRVGKYIKQSGGKGQYGHVVLEIIPAEGKEFEFENKTVGGVIPKEYIPSIEKGVREALEKGVVLGYPLINVKVDLLDGSYHEVDSSEMAFKFAASMAVKDAVQKGQSHHPRARHEGRSQRTARVHGSGHRRH